MYAFSSYSVRPSENGLQRTLTSRGVVEDNQKLEEAVFIDSPSPTVSSEGDSLHFIDHHLGPIEHTRTELYGERYSMNESFSSKDPSSFSRRYSSSEVQRGLVASSVALAQRWKLTGYNPFQLDSKGYTALHHATRKGDLSLIKSLLEAYDGNPLALLRIRSRPHEQNVLHLAARYGYLEILQLYLMYLTSCLDDEKIIVLDSYELSISPIISERDKHGNTPLHFAVASKQNKAKIVQLLLQYKADTSPINHQQLTPLFVYVATAGKDDPEICHLLLKNGAHVNETIYRQQSILFLAIQRRLWHVAAILVFYGANINEICIHTSKMIPELIPSSYYQFLTSFVASPVPWVTIDRRPYCMICRQRFKVFFCRPHHCRLCGRILCIKCCSMKRRIRFFYDDEFSRTEDYRSTERPITEVRVCIHCVNVKRVAAKLLDDEIYPISK